MAIGGYAMGAGVGYNYIRGEFLGEPIPRFEAALEEAYKAGLLGKSIQGSGVDFDLHCFIGAGAYICGEEMGLLESTRGKPGKPASSRHSRRPPVCTASRPPSTTRQSYASVPTILRKGPAWFAGLGPQNSGGTLIFFRFWPRRKARQFRSGAWHPVQGAARARRRHEGWPEDEGLHTGRALRAGRSGRGDDWKRTWTTTRSGRSARRSVPRRSS